MDIVCKAKDCEFLRVFQVPRGCDGPADTCTAAVPHTCISGDFKPMATQAKSNYSAWHLENILKDAVLASIDGQQCGNHEKKTEIDVTNKDRIFVFKDLTENQGFRVKILLSTQQELKARFINRCKKDFAKAENQASNFDEKQADFRRSSSLTPSLWSLRTEVDAAHTMLDDTLFSRVTADANDRIVTLGMALFSDTENATTATMFNKFCASVMPELKSRRTSPSPMLQRAASLRM
ncbi:hypothetical protein CTAYLR_003984 [Chrysophaeum taylorii]|uniref:Uncharacterized protein n=1 Tax=Chrysophaeum taylorii TaxID=2483200 RepID=A0AAD7UFG5_9STRA|nr:hypothetical protein CTAYLR_003984 [Chrysophaeum taylorii]